MSSTKKIAPYLIALWNKMYQEGKSIKRISEELEIPAHIVNKHIKKEIRRPSNKTNTIEDFWANIDKTGNCWIWIGRVGERGYGEIGIFSKAWTAHRLSYKVHKGDIPNGLFVCHKCDNPLCVNPAHLFLGTTQDNIDDMIRKGRGHWQKKKQTSA